MSRILVVGDIHGHNNGFELLLEKVDYRPQQDLLFILGDFLDKRRNLQLRLIPLK